MNTFYYKITTPNGEVVLISFNPDEKKLGFKCNMNKTPIAKIDKQEFDHINQTQSY